MRTYKRSLKDLITQVDPVLFFCTLAISALSLITLVSGKEVFGMRRIIMQAAMTVVGTVIMFVIANLDYQEVVERLYIAMFLGSIIFLASVLLFGVAEGENKSWITVVDIGYGSYRPKQRVRGRVFGFQRGYQAHRLRRRY